MPDEMKLKPDTDGEEKPTIAELEKRLNDDPDFDIEILPSGEIIEKPPKSKLEESPNSAVVSSWLVDAGSEMECAREHVDEAIMKLDLARKAGKQPCPNGENNISSRAISLLKRTREALIRPLHADVRLSLQVEVDELLSETADID